MRVKPGCEGMALHTITPSSLVSRFANTALTAASEPQRHDQLDTFYYLYVYSIPSTSNLATRPFFYCCITTAERALAALERQHDFGDDGIEVPTSLSS